MSTVVPERSRDALIRASQAAGSELALFESVSHHLRELVPFDGAAWFATDPATILATSAVRVENIEAMHCATFWERECLVPDVIPFKEVARSSQGVATLYEATGRRPAQSARYREYLAPQGYGDELRAAFRTGETTWGVLNLYRDRSRGAFTARECEQVRQIAPAVARGLRSFATQVRDVAAAEGPGTALFQGYGKLVSLDARAEQFFEEIGGPAWKSFPVAMTPVRAVVARADAVADAQDPGTASANSTAPAAWTRLRAPSGRWFVLDASTLRGPDGSPGPTAVTVQPARSEQIAPIIVLAYALTSREQQITRAVARGLSSHEIAAELFLSPHTVRDYLKTVFAKVEVASRGELVAKLYAQHHQEQMHGSGQFVQW